MKSVVSVRVNNSPTGYFRKVYRSLQVQVPHNILKDLSIQKCNAKAVSSIKFTQKLLCFYFYL